MEAAFAEMPLALFTTFASLGAGAFIVVAVALFTAKFSAEELKKIDRMMIVPLVLVIVGFVAAFFHLSTPANAMNVFAGVGSSPLSNEIVAGIVFTVAAVVYVICGLAGKLSEGARRGLSAVAAVLAVVFAFMMGTAYMMDTIASWSTPLVPLQMLGFALAGGAATATFVIALAGAADTMAASSFKAVGMVVFAAGVVLGVGCLAAQAGAVSGMENALVAGASLVDEAMMYVVAAGVLLVIACVCGVLALRGKSAIALAGVSVVLAFAGILCARLAFYAMQLSVGLCL